MESRIATEHVYVLQDVLAAEQARDKALSNKKEAFGTLQSLLFRPKDDDIQISRTEKRYEPFWHVACRGEVDYGMRTTLTITTPTPHAYAVVLPQEQDKEQPSHPVDAKGTFTMPALAQCREERTRDLLIDGLTGQAQPTLQRYKAAAKQEVPDLATFEVGNAILVPPQYRASYVLRQPLSEMMFAIQADELYREIVEVTHLDLYFRPIYAFEYSWAAKDRRVTVDIDGVTGELKGTAHAIGQISTDLGKFLTPELLFDIGADAIDLLIPGGGIVMKVGRAIAQRQRNNEQAKSEP